MVCLVFNYCFQIVIFARLLEKFFGSEKKKKTKNKKIRWGERMNYHPTISECEGWNEKISLAFMPEWKKECQNESMFWA